MQIFPCGDRTYSIPDVPWNKLRPPAPRCLWSNDHWAITENGIEPLYSANPDRYLAYVIPAEKLLDTRGFIRPVYFWLIQVHRQPWLNYPAFEEAFKKAIEIHARAKRLVVDEGILNTTFLRTRIRQSRLSQLTGFDEPPARR